MSNYLNHLVTRSLDSLATSVQPLLPSIFEPVTGMPSLGGVVLNTEEPEGIDNIDLPQLQQVKAPEFGLEPAPPTSTPNKLLAPQATVSISQLQQDLYSSPAVTNTVHLQDSRQREPVISQPAIVQRVAEQLLPSPLVPASLSQNFDPTPRQPEDRSAAIDPPSFSIAHKSPPLPTSSPLQPAPREPIKPQITTLIQPVQTPDLVAPKADSPVVPTIQVTIGRIEVRATPAVAPTTLPARPKSPVMSLDEYLHRRGGGG
jgi:hypothetical protein